MPIAERRKSAASAIKSQKLFEMSRRFTKPTVRWGGNCTPPINPKRIYRLMKRLGFIVPPPRIERHFHLFKSAPIGISPMYVRNDDQIKGLARLLSLCVRHLTLIEIVCRRHLEANRRTAKPTATRLSHAFGGIHRVRLPNQVTSYTAPLTDLQQRILSMLCITKSVYQARAPDSHHSSPSNERADKF